MDPRQVNGKQPKLVESHGTPSGSSVPSDTFRIDPEVGGQRTLLDDQAPVVMSMPFRDGTSYPLTAAMIAKLKTDYPGLSNIEANLRNCRVYLENNPQKRPHKLRFMRQRIANWLKSDEADETERRRVGPVSVPSRRAFGDVHGNVERLRKFSPTRPR